MLTRFLLTLAAVGSVAGSTRADPGKPAPTVVVQTQPGGKLLTDVQDLIKQYAGPGKGQMAVKEFQQGLEDTLGEKGFEGVDLNRPAAAYATVREKFEDSSIVLVVPVTTEKDFLGLLDRLKFKVTEVKDKKGLHQLVPHDEDLFPHDSYVRFVDGWAYVGFNGDDVTDPANLVPAAGLIDPQQDAQLVARFYPDRLPEKHLKSTLAEFENNANGLRQFLLPQDPKAVADGAGKVLDEGLKLLRRTAEKTRRDGQEITLKYHFDAAAATAMEVVVVPKAGTELARAIAARKPTTNRFAGLVGPDTVVGFAGQLPLFAPETRAMAGAGFDTAAALAETEDGVPEPLRPVVAAACKGLARTVKAGTGDFAAALVGPDKDGRFTGVAAVSFDDPAEVEKELRAAVEKNELVRKLVKLDADKVDGVPVHTAAAGPLLGTFVADLFGKDAVVCLAFGKDAVCASVGPPGPAARAVAAAIGMKAMPAPAVEVVVNPSRAVKAVTAAWLAERGKLFADLLGGEDKRITAYSVTVAGGDRLTVRVEDRLLYLLQRLNPDDFAPPGR